MRIRFGNFLSQDDQVLELIAGANVTLAVTELPRSGVQLSIASSGSGGGGAGDGGLEFTRQGIVIVGTGVNRRPLNGTETIVAVRAMVGTAPTGAALICDVNKNGTGDAATIFTTQANRPTIAIGATDSGAAIPDVTTLAAGDYLTIDVDQVGSTVPGADLTVVVFLA